MLALLLVLTLDPSPAFLDALQGTWRAADGTMLVVDGADLTATAPDGLNGFTAELHATRDRLRLVDRGGTLERPYRVDNGRLWLDGVEYRRVRLATGNGDAGQTIPAANPRR